MIIVETTKELATRLQLIDTGHRNLCTPQDFLFCSIQLIFSFKLYVLLTEKQSYACTCAVVKDEAKKHTLEAASTNDFRGTRDGPLNQPFRDSRVGTLKGRAKE